MIGTSTDIYDALAPHYRKYSEKKSAYLRAIDEYIIEHIPESAGSLLDVGAGDGVRGMAIAHAKGIECTILCDVSAKMVARCKNLNASEVWLASAEELPATEKRFDVIFCLWNVLGHLSGRAARVKALTAMKQLLADDGVLFFDVNNRHNASAYGKLEVLKRVIIDCVCPDERRGDAEFDWEIGDKVFPAKGHLFTPFEIEGIIKESGLQIKERVAVHYGNGEISHHPWRGQLLYLLGK